MPRPLSPAPLVKRTAPSTGHQSSGLERLRKYLHVAPELRDRFNSHVRAWARRLLMVNVNSRLGTASIGCTKCGLCAGRRNIVLYRGNMPCDILFIGEAPGEMEDGIGVPFIGPAGTQLQSMWTEACIHSKTKLTYGITNVVACIPRSPVTIGTGEIRTPHKEEVAACQPRLLEVMELANPRAIVLLGDIAKRFFPKEPPYDKMKRWDGKVTCLAHPARILHLLEESPNAAALIEKKFILGLSTVMKELTSEQD